MAVHHSVVIVCFCHSTPRQGWLSVNCAHIYHVMSLLDCGLGWQYSRVPVTVSPSVLYMHKGVMYVMAEYIQIHANV